MNANENKKLLKEGNGIIIPYMAQLQVIFT